MEKVIEMVSINGLEDHTEMSVFNHQECPFLLQDMPLPQCNTGFVYMLVSTRDHTFCYIGETVNITVRLNQHNSGYGSITTCHSSLHPYALFAYVCGFDDNKRLRRSFEFMWKIKRDEEINRG